MYAIFADEGASSSLIGTTAENHQDKATIKLHLRPRTYMRTIRHEFGHALGMRHEHQQKGAPQLYNEKELRNHVEKVMFKDDGPPSDANEKKEREKKVENKIRRMWKKFQGDSTAQHSRYDKHSVMHYL